MSASQGYTVLIDGYNVIKRHAAWERLSLHEARTRLVALLGQTRWPVPVSRVMIIFDSPDPDGTSLQISNSLFVRFAAPCADAEIQHLIRTSSSPLRVIVMSDDGEILRTAKSYRTLRYPTKWLFEHGSTTRRQPPESDKVPPSAEAARRITEELAKRWLRRPAA